MLSRLLAGLGLSVLLVVCVTARADDTPGKKKNTREDDALKDKDLKPIVEDSAIRHKNQQRAFESFRQKLAVLAGRLENGTDKDKEVPSFQPHKLLFSVRASVFINCSFQSASDCSGAIDWLSTRLTARRARPLESAEPIPALYPPSDITEPGARASARRGTTRAPRCFANSPWPSCSSGRKGANNPYQKCG